MRERRQWQKDLAARLRQAWPGGPPPAGSVNLVCEVELGLALLEQLGPTEPVDGLWTALTGYPYPLDSAGANADLRRQVAVARHLLLPFKSRGVWREAVDAYTQVPEQIRGYRLEGTPGHAMRRKVTLVPERWKAYERALSEAPPIQRRLVAQAKDGVHLFPTRQGRASVRIPPELVVAPPRGHQLARTRKRPCIRPTWAELLETAAWMDERLARDYHGRLNRVTLELRDTDQQPFQKAKRLPIDELLHIVGMVGAGKSTLMDVLAVWAARQGLRTTLVVGDVVGALEKAALLRELGIAAAPVLGGFNRGKHLDRLHRVLARRQASLLAQEHDGFTFLSTACALDGLRDVARPLGLSEAPCTSLQPATDEGNLDAAEPEDHQERGLVCPYYGACQRHTAVRDLVDASVWVATPASLVYTPVPEALNPERVRYAELVARRSDLVIVDEADRVQVQLDEAFSPSQVLIGRGGEGWLDTVVPQAEHTLRVSGRRQFEERGVRTWMKAGTAAQMATHRLYALLSEERGLEEWIRRDYFTEWTLSERLARDWSGLGGNDPEATNDTYVRVRAAFDAFLKDPLAEDDDASASELAAIAKRILPDIKEETARRPLRDWLAARDDLVIPDAERRSAAIRLEFTLLMAILADRLNILIRGLRQVDVPLGLDGAASRFFQRPPDDFAPLIPEAPMGNVLGFQYIQDPERRHELGELRFFRCAGVGRWLLLHLHELLQADGIAGPNVLLLSATSWAGASASYHVQVPVRGILHAPPEEVAAIEQSTFRFEPQFNDHQEAISISGRRGGPRQGALNDLIVALARRTRVPGATGVSRLELERDTLDPGRQRVLLVVGSYLEAKQAYTALVKHRPEWSDQARYLVADDDTGESAWAGIPGGGLRRGEVDRLAETDAWILIAPLQAIERGHNILNEDARAALGAAFFLVRHYPRPDDLGHAIHAINRWAVEHATGATAPAPRGAATLETRGVAFRQAAHARWRWLLRQPLIAQIHEPAELAALHWSELVMVWQVIGRLVRGGCTARVYFCDAAFARGSARAERPDTARTSFLIGFKEVLSPYFDPAVPTISDADRELVQKLYGPLYHRLDALEGVTHAL